MVKSYDRAVKKLIEVFTNNIPVIGLQNEDSSENALEALKQAALNTKEDKIPFPLISVFRKPEIQITDGSQTKRASTEEGYLFEDGRGNRAELVAMRSTLSYAIDVFDVSKEAAEEIATKLFFRLRNNPQLEVKFSFPDLAGQEITCLPEIQLEPTIRHMRLNDSSKAQAYKIRIEFNLVNANIFDVITLPEFGDFTYHITVELLKS